VSIPSQATIVVLVVLAAVFLEAGNGANFSLLPHVHPEANGLVSGLTGAAGNLGGVLFAIVFRSVGKSGTSIGYAKEFQVLGFVNLAICVAVGWTRPVPKLHAS